MHMLGKEEWFAMSETERRKEGGRREGGERKNVCVGVCIGGHFCYIWKANFLFLLLSFNSFLYQQIRMSHECPSSLGVSHQNIRKNLLTSRM